ncbi:FAD-dependent oxidoreductase [Tistrella bauzanensis]|uniref:FAD-dependent oxidoreductase n=1 Tax=Tistrella TaxID=171436 RepID=UPI0031F63611
MSRLVDCDVVIVGGGVAGLAAAIDLRRRAFRVTVLEATAGAGRDLDGTCGLIGTEGRAALARLLGEEDAAALVAPATSPAGAADTLPDGLGTLTPGGFAETLSRRARERGVDLREGVAATGASEAEAGYRVTCAPGYGIAGRLMAITAGPARGEVASWLGVSVAVTPAVSLRLKLRPDRITPDGARTRPTDVVIAEDGRVVLRGTPDGGWLAALHMDGSVAASAAGAAAAAAAPVAPLGADQITAAAARVTAALPDTAGQLLTRMWRIAGQTPDAPVDARAIAGKPGLFVADAGGGWDMGAALIAGERLAALLAG